jgi:hypothetical protein
MNFLMNRFGSGSGLFGKRMGVAAAAAATAVIVMTAAGLYKRYKLQVRFKEHQSRLKQQQESAFENRHLKEYDELADDPDAPVPPPNAHVRETTPQGDVIMTYDADRSMFCYYCDKRSVQFKYLEPVARKYVVEHGCKRLYIDLRKATATKELTKAACNGNNGNGNNGNGNNGNGNNGKTEGAEKPSEAVKTVFAQLKKYGNPKPTQGVQPKPQKEVTRYLYCGRLDEFNPADSANTHEFSIIKPIDYASYKKMSSS